MKRILIFSILLLGMQNLMAQGVKIGFIHSDTVLMSMPEYEGARKQIETYSNQLSAQLQSKGAEFEEKARDFEQNSASWTDIVVADKRDELARMETNIRDFQQQAENKLREKENTVMSPLYDKIEAAIKEVATEDGYDYVTPRQIFLFVNNQHNLTGKVIAKLGGTKPENN